MDRGTGDCGTACRSIMRLLYRIVSFYDMVGETCRQLSATVPPPSVFLTVADILSFLPR